MIDQNYLSGDVAASTDGVCSESAIAIGDYVGDYRLDKLLWTDPYAAAFWACRDGMIGGHIVQIPVDDRQCEPNLHEKLATAVETLRLLELSELHLTPTRAERARLREGEQSRSTLDFLVYDRPGWETANDWRTVSPTLFNSDPNERRDSLLNFAVQVSSAVAELHAKRVPHGNLGPAAVVVLAGTALQAKLKDAWVWRCFPDRRARPEYVSPDGGGNEFYQDSWGLSLVLDALRNEGDPADPSVSLAADVPVLDRIIHNLRMPSPRLRPSISLVRDRLAFARKSDGVYLGSFERGLSDHIQAGHRLFAVQVDDLEELESAFMRLSARGHRLYIARDQVGLIDMRQNAVLEQWDPQTRNGEKVLARICSLRRSKQEPTPIVLIQGSQWWRHGTAGSRVLRSIQAASPDSAAVIVADSVVMLDQDIAEVFVKVGFPPLEPAALFDHILRFPEDNGVSLNLSATAAIRLAEDLYPISRRDATQCLRMCLQRHGHVDERAIEIRDEMRADLFQKLGSLSYRPLAKLPAIGTVGLTESVHRELSGWADYVTKTTRDDRTSSSAQQRVLLWGPEGCGKTVVAASLAARLKRPFIRMDPSSCLRGKLGESEDALRFALSLVGTLWGSVVLLDDIAGFVPVKTGNPIGVGAPLDATGQPVGAPAIKRAAKPRGETALASTLQRMSGILLHWLDNLPPGCVVVLTAAAPEALQAPWRWRVDRSFELSSTFDNKEQRAAVIAATLRCHGLNDLADDQALVADLAAGTHPEQGSPGIASASARAAFGPLRRQVVRLDTAADISSWMRDTILLHGRTGDPTSVSFWRAALTPIKEIMTDA